MIRTKKGRVVYERATHRFTFWDVARISRSLARHFLRVVVDSTEDVWDELTAALEDAFSNWDVVEMFSLEDRAQGEALESARILSAERRGIVIIIEEKEQD